MQELLNTIARSGQAQSIFAGLAAAERAQCLTRLAESIRRHKEEFSILISRESRKPVTESATEVEYAASYLDFYAAEATQIQDSILMSPFPDRSVRVIHEPVGVTAAITPWNFPLAMITRKLAPALAAGCSMIVKPSEITPQTALVLQRLALEAGIADGVVEVVCGDPQTIGQTLCTHPDIAKVSFTGSSRVGSLLMSQCAGTVKRMSLELGGNAPFIVHDDADLKLAADNLMACKFRNAGQTCIAANRILVHKNIAAEFLNLIREQVERIRVGNPLDSTTTMGPLINQTARKKVQALVHDALERGAVLAYESKSSWDEPDYYPPTILTGLQTTMRIFQEEIFGPVIAIKTYETLDEALCLANATPAGLAAYGFSQCSLTLRRMQSELRFGMIGLNTAVISSASVPFGGIKCSGFGREGARQGLLEYLNLKYLCIRE